MIHAADRCCKGFDSERLDVAAPAGAGRPFQIQEIIVAQGW